MANYLDETGLKQYDELIKQYIGTEIEQIGPTSNLIEIIYDNLVKLRNASKLLPGFKYRITDFVTTVANNDEFKSAGHRFDIIVEAISNNQFSENAAASLHEGDTYFSGCKITQWQLKYDIDNDPLLYGWADSINGKGVIYYMKDEYGNEFPYDFKNVQYKRYKIKTNTHVKTLESTYLAWRDRISRTASTPDYTSFIWCYTFSYNEEFIETNTLYDPTVKQDIIKTYIPIFNVCQPNAVNGTYQLNNIVFLSYKPTYDTTDSPMFDTGPRNNTFGPNCVEMSFGFDSIEDNRFLGFDEDIILEHGQLRNYFGNATQSSVIGRRSRNNYFLGNNYSIFLQVHAWENIFGQQCYCIYGGHGFNSNIINPNSNKIYFGQSAVNRLAEVHDTVFSGRCANVVVNNTPSKKLGSLHVTNISDNSYAGKYAITLPIFPDQLNLPKYVEGTNNGDLIAYYKDTAGVTMWSTSKYTANNTWTDFSEVTQEIPTVDLSGIGAIRLNDIEAKNNFIKNLCDNHPIDPEIYNTYLEEYTKIVDNITDDALASAVNYNNAVIAVLKHVDQKIIDDFDIGLQLVEKNCTDSVTTNLKNDTEFKAELKGDKGDTGLQGPKGDKGDKGDTGIAALKIYEISYQMTNSLTISTDYDVYLYNIPSSADTDYTINVSLLDPTEFDKTASKSIALIITNNAGINYNYPIVIPQKATLNKVSTTVINSYDLNKCFAGKTIEYNFLVIPGKTVRVTGNSTF